MNKVLDEMVEASRYAMPADPFAGLDQDPRLDKAEAEPARLGLLKDAASAFRFMTGGNATVTLVSTVTGNRFTYRIQTSKDGRMRFVSLLTGADNESSYSYIGHCQIGREVFYPGKKSKVSAEALSVKGFRWAWGLLAGNKMPPTLEVWHEGKCGRCGRKLTVPSSVESGIGPECAGKMTGA